MFRISPIYLDRNLWGVIYSFVYLKIIIPKNNRISTILLDLDPSYHLQSDLMETGEFYILRSLEGYKSELAYPPEAVPNSDVTPIFS